MEGGMLMPAFDRAKALAFQRLLRRGGADPGTETPSSSAVVQDLGRAVAEIELDGEGVISGALEDASSRLSTAAVEVLCDADLLLRAELVDACIQVVDSRRLKSCAVASAVVLCTKFGLRRLRSLKCLGFSMEEVLGLWLSHYRRGSDGYAQELCQLDWWHWLLSRLHFSRRADIAAGTSSSPSEEDDSAGDGSPLFDDELDDCCGLQLMDVSDGAQLWQLKRIADAEVAKRSREEVETCLEGVLLISGFPYVKSADVLLWEDTLTQLFCCKAPHCEVTVVCTPSQTTADRSVSHTPVGGAVVQLESESAAEQLRSLVHGFEWLKGHILVAACLTSFAASEPPGTCPSTPEPLAAESLESGSPDAFEWHLPSFAPLSDGLDDHAVQETKDAAASDTEVFERSHQHAESKARSRQDEQPSQIDVKNLELPFRLHGDEGDRLMDAEKLSRAQPKTEAEQIEVELALLYRDEAVAKQAAGYASDYLDLRPSAQLINTDIPERQSRSLQFPSERESVMHSSTGPFELPLGSLESRRQWLEDVENQCLRLQLQDAQRLAEEARVQASIERTRAATLLSLRGASYQHNPGRHRPPAEEKRGHDHTDLEKPDGMPGRAAKASTERSPDRVFPMGEKDDWGPQRANRSGTLVHDYELLRAEAKECSRPSRFRTGERWGAYRDDTEVAVFEDNFAVESSSQSSGPPSRSERRRWTQDMSRAEEDKAAQHFARSSAEEMRREDILESHRFALSSRAERQHKEEKAKESNEHRWRPTRARPPATVHAVELSSSDSLSDWVIDRVPSPLGATRTHRHTRRPMRRQGLQDLSDVLRSDASQAAEARGALDWRRRRHRNRRSRSRRAEEPQAVDSIAHSSEVFAAGEECSDSNLTASHACVICLTNAKNLLFLPCRHLCVCKTCGEDRRLQSCPVCRAGISQRIRVFL